MIENLSSLKDFDSLTFIVTLSLYLWLFRRRRRYWASCLPHWCGLAPLRRDHRAGQHAGLGAAHTPARVCWECGGRSSGGPTTATPATAGWSEVEGRGREGIGVEHHEADGGEGEPAGGWGGEGDHGEGLGGEHQLRESTRGTPYWYIGVLRFTVSTQKLLMLARSAFIYLELFRANKACFIYILC